VSCCSCPAGDLAVQLQQDTAAMNASSLNSIIECPHSLPGSTEPGC
jgi:hypothetical protein